MSDKDREMIARIDEVRCEVAAMWEDRLLYVFHETWFELQLFNHFNQNHSLLSRTEMLRLKEELETCFAEDRMDAVHRAQKEHIDDVNELKESFSFREKILLDELETIKEKLADRNRRLDEANDKADKQIMQIRMILNKSEQGHQREFHSQAVQHESQIGKTLTFICDYFDVHSVYLWNLDVFELDRLRDEFAEKEAKLKADFEAKLDEIKRKNADELSSCRAEMIAKLKRDYGRFLESSHFSQTGSEKWMKKKSIFTQFSHTFSYFPFYLHHLK